MGLPKGVVFNKNPAIPHELSTNVRHDPSILHYISIEGYLLTKSSSNYLDRIIVYANFYQWKCFAGARICPSLKYYDVGRFSYRDKQ